ncbi:hypothetical protein MUO66_06900 [Candidatus Bathyarchaeota archaeon]|nr:hypothetical protein [Candidatus Bathyarchaeota archaeon]
MVKSKKPKDEEKLENTKSNKSNSDLLEKNTSQQILLCIGEYSSKIIIQDAFQNKKDAFSYPLLVSKFKKDVNGWSQSIINKKHILSLEKNVDSHFWHQILPVFSENNVLIDNLKKSSIDNIKGAIVFSSLWDGFGSALTPTLISQFKESNTNSIVFGILPSQIQTSDAHFNAFSSVGLCLSKNFTPIVLIDRDQLENFLGIDRQGSIIKGSSVVNFLLDLIQKKESFVQEISELTRAFSVRSYTVMLASGASLSVYGSLKNILNAALLRPLLKFKLSSSNIVYAIFRIPTRMKKMLSKNNIELSLANWFKEKTNLKSIQISEPIYIDSKEDRIDLALFIGGFELADIFTPIMKKIQPMKNNAIKKGLIKKKDWEVIVKELIPS